jgi:hypothetical protein
MSSFTLGQKLTTWRNKLKNVSKKMAENIQQGFQMATTNAQLSLLATFSNDTKEDKSLST